MVLWCDHAKNVLSDIESWPTSRHNNSTKHPLQASMTPHFKEEEMKFVGELSRVWSPIVLKYLYFSRIGRSDTLLSVNKLARFVTKWTKTCDKRLNRLISYIHHTCEYKQYCHVEILSNNADWNCFKTLILREILKIRNPNILGIFGSHTFVPMSWMCRNQISVSHSSKESDIIFSGRLIEIRRTSWSRVVGSDCFCFKNHDSDNGENGATCCHWKKSKISREVPRFESYWSCSFKRPVFASRSFVVCVWKQWNSDQDDH